MRVREASRISRLPLDCEEARDRPESGTTNIGGIFWGGSIGGGLAETGLLDGWYALDSTLDNPLPMPDDAEVLADCADRWLIFRSLNAETLDVDKDVRA